MLYFHYPKSLVVNGKTIFCNMRLIGNQILLTGAVYLNSPIEYSQLELLVNGEKQAFQVIERRAYEPSVICIYENDKLLELSNISLQIKYQNHSYEYSLEKENYPKYNIVSMTVFKDDYRLMELYVDYYSKLGVDAFFFYYNGKLDEKMYDFIKDSSHSIHITEWNYQYWTNPNIVLKYCSGHHAQPMAIMDSLYWLKKVSNYCLYNDFDEYIFSNHSLSKFVKLLPDVNHFGFICYWSKVGEDTVTYENIKQKFYELELIKGKDCGMERRKCMVKLSDIKIMRVHFPSDYNKQEKNIFIHGFHHICNFEEMDRRYFMEKNVVQHNECIVTYQDILLNNFLNQDKMELVDRYLCKDHSNIEHIKPFVKKEIFCLNDNPIEGFELTRKYQDCFVFKRMETVRVGFEYFWPNFLQKEERNIMLHLLSLIPNSIYETNLENCDVIYHSFFGNPFAVKKYPNKKYIFFSGEKYQIPTEQYSLSIYQKQDAQKIVCYPFFFTILHAYSPRYNIVMNQNNNSTIPSEFCAFIVGNPSCQIRNNFFQYLSQKYKKVNSYGKVLNNMGFIPDFPYNDERQLQLLSKHKFVICFENTKTDDYYITEKLLIAKAAGCVPIYWGTSKCFELFDKNAFLYLDGDNIEAMDKLVSKIKMIDSNYKLFLEIRKRPLLTTETTEKFSKNVLLDKIKSYL